MSSGQRTTPSGQSGPSTAGALLRGLLLIAVAIVLGVVLLDATDEPVAVEGDDVEEVSAADLGAVQRPQADDEPGLADGTTSTTETTVEDADAASADGDEADSNDADSNDADSNDAGVDAAGDADATEGDEAVADEAEGTGEAEAGDEAGGGSPREASEVTVLVANGSGVSGRAAEITEQVGTAGYSTAAPSNVNGGGTVPASTVYYAEGFEADAAAVAATLSPPPQVSELPDPAPVSDLRGAQILLVLGPDVATD